MVVDNQRKLPRRRCYRGKRKSTVQTLNALIRMYEPHVAREDTVLFPAFHAMFTEKEFDALGDRFEDY